MVKSILNKKSVSLIALRDEQAIDFAKEIVDNRPQIKEKRRITKKDVYAVILTIIVVLILGVILWFIPFTNGWMRELLFENPLFSWMFK